MQATIEMMALKDCVRYFQRMYPKEKWDAQFCAGEPCRGAGAVCPPGRTAAVWCMAGIRLEMHQQSALPAPLVQDLLPSALTPAR